MYSINTLNILVVKILLHEKVEKVTNLGIIKVKNKSLLH